MSDSGHCYKTRAGTYTLQVAKEGKIRLQQRQDNKRDDIQTTGWKGK